MRHVPSGARLALLGVVVGLSGCASFSADRGMDMVADLASKDLHKQTVALRSDDDVSAAQGTVSHLLARPLTADTAVQIALLSNRDLQAEYNALGLAEAARLEASLPTSPRISLSDIAGSGAFEIERQIVGDILSLATLSKRTEIAGDRFRQAQLRAGLETLRVAATARRAYVRAVGARALIGALTEAEAAGDASLELAKRLGESGAMNKLDQAREQVFYAELSAQLASARENVVTEREGLVRAMGLWGRDLTFRLPDVLPRLPSRPQTAATIEADAVRRRIDLQIARIEVETIATSYGLTQATRFINLLEVSGVSKTQREPGGKAFDEGGLGVEFQVPLFDFGEVRQRQAEETYMQAVNRLLAKAINVRSQAREAYQRYRSSYDIARHYQTEVLPLRKVISDETLLRYNSMQIDVFALLTEAQARIRSTVSALNATRDFWLADTDLAAALVGGDMSSESGTPAPSSTTTSQND